MSKAKREAAEAEVFENQTEKDILWAIHKNLIALDLQVKTIRQICVVWFILMLLSIIGGIFVLANHSSTTATVPTVSTFCDPTAAPGAIDAC